MFIYNPVFFVLWEVLLMEKKNHRLTAIIMLGVVGGMVFAGYSASAEITWVPHKPRGTVEFAKLDESLWKPLTKETVLGTEYYIRTAKSSAVELKKEDGTILHIGENRQLAVATLLSSRIQQKLEPHKITGAVKIVKSESLSWKPLTKEMPLKGEYCVRTGKDSGILLTKEDGKRLYIGENRQLAIMELLTPKPQQTRSLSSNVLNKKVRKVKTSADTGNGKCSVVRVPRRVNNRTTYIRKVICR